MQVIRYFPIAFPSQQPTGPLHRVPAKAVLDIIHDLVQPDLLPALLTIEQKPLTSSPKIGPGKVRESSRAEGVGSKYSAEVQSVIPPRVAPVW